MTRQDKHKFAASGNPLSIQGRAPGVVFSKELLEHAERMIEHAAIVKAKKKKK